MNVLERVQKIKNLATKLAVMDSLTATLLIRQFGWTPYSYIEGSSDERMHILIGFVQELSDTEISELSSAVDSLDLNVPEESSSADSADVRYRLFISHRSDARHIASEFKSNLSFMCIDAFVAHEDIGDNEVWKSSLQLNLDNCDGFIALVTDGFEESIWCQQEIGWATARKIQTMGIRFRDPVPPLGLLGEKQLIRFSDYSDIARRVKDVITSTTTGMEKWRLSVLAYLESATSWNQVRNYWKHIENFGKLNQQETELLTRAIRNNSYVSTSNIDYTDDGSVVRSYLADNGTY
jgi:hypothetical protein